MELRLAGLHHAYGDVEVLRGIDLAIPSGRIVCIIGPSGCGKSTLLRLIGGLERPDRGRVIQIGETPPGSLNPLTYIFQDFALLPWRTVEGNVRLGHRVVVLSRRPGQVREILEIDLPLEARAAHARDLEAHQRRLWTLIRDEAQAAELELVDG